MFLLQAGLIKMHVFLKISIMFSKQFLTNTPKSSHGKNFMQ